MIKRVLLCLALCAMAYSATLKAHHSGANFDPEKTVELTGVITDYSYRNPHIYLEIQAVNPDGSQKLWLIEGHSVTGARRIGWDRDSLSEGDQVTVIANPDRDSNKAFGILNLVQKSDGTQLYGFRKPVSEVEPIPIEPASDFSGTWDMDLSTFNFYSANAAPSDDMPLTDPGKVQRDAFSVNQNPAIVCQTVAVPRMVIWPYGYNFTRLEDRLLIEKEHENLTRTIYLDRTLDEALSNAQPSYLGTSIGKFEGPEKLIIETAGFRPTPWGISSGLDSSDQKTVIETYELAEDGLSMNVRYQVSDPVFLTEPFVVSGRYKKGEERAFIQEPCDPDAAKRHETAE